MLMKLTPYRWTGENGENVCSEKHWNDGFLLRSGSGSDSDFGSVLTENRKDRISKISGFCDDPETIRKSFLEVKVPDGGDSCNSEYQSVI